jgi:hypothetical protein
MAVEEITEGVRNLAVEGEPAAAAAAAGGGGEGAQRRAAGSSSNRIQVSNTKKPLFFYVNLAKVCHSTRLASSPCPSREQQRFLLTDWIGFVFMQRYMQQHGDVELSALGMGASRSLLPVHPWSRFGVNSGGFRVIGVTLVELIRPRSY